MKSKEAKFKANMELPKAISYLSDVVTALKAGAVSVQNGTQELSLKPQDMVKVELEAVQKADRESLMFSISWRKEVPLNGNIELRISPERPADVHAEGA